MISARCIFVLAAVAVAASVPIEDDGAVSPMHDARAEAEEAISLLQSQGMGDNACADLADSTIKEIKESVGAEQKVLDSLDKGDDCKTEGDDLVKAATKTLAGANQAASNAAAAVTKAQGAPVAFGSVEFGSIKEGDCNILDNSNYASAKQNLEKAKASAQATANAAKSAKDSLADVKKAAANAKKNCACTAKNTMDKAWATASKSSIFNANDKAFQKANQMKCVLKGTTGAKCSSSATPRVSKPSLATGVAALCQGAQTRRV